MLAQWCALLLLLLLVRADVVNLSSSAAAGALRAAAGFATWVCAALQGAALQDYDHEMPISTCFWLSSRRDRSMQSFCCCRDSTACVPSSPACYVSLLVLSLKAKRDAKAGVLLQHDVVYATGPAPKIAGEAPSPHTLQERHDLSTGMIVFGDRGGLLLLVKLQPAAACLTLTTLALTGDGHRRVTVALKKDLADRISCAHCC